MAAEHPWLTGPQVDLLQQLASGPFTIVGDKGSTEEERAHAQEQCEWLVEWRSAGLVDLDGPPHRASTSAAGGWLVVHARRLTEKGRRVLASYGPPPEVLVCAVEGRIAVMLGERRTAFAAEYHALRDDVTRRGMTNSSRYMVRLREIVRAELTARAREASRFWSRMALEKGWQPTIMLEAVVRSSLAAAIRTGGDLGEPLRIASGEGLLPPLAVEQLYSDAADSAVQQWIYDMHAPDEPNSVASGSPHYGDRITVNAPVGAVQTGQGAVANVEMTWNPQSVESLRSQLSALRSEVAREGANLPEVQAVEGVLDLAAVESNRDVPSVSKLRQYLISAAALIQTAGAMPEAYKLLKALAGLLHLPLP